MLLKGVSVVPLIVYSEEEPVACEAGDDVGGKLSLGSMGFGPDGDAVLDSLQFADSEAQDAVTELIIFDRDPEAATLTDNAALVLSTDVAYVVARIHIAAADYVTINGTSFVNKENLGILVRSAESDRSLYAALMTSGTPTYTIGSLRLNLNFSFSF